MTKKSTLLVDTPLIEAIDSNPDLSPITKQNYRDRLRAILNHVDGKTIDHVLLHPTTYIPLLRKWYPLATSHKIHFTALLALFKYNPKYREAHREAHEAWVKAFRDADQEVNDRYEKNEPTDRQVAGFVPYGQIIEAREALPSGHIHRLLLGMYTHLRPMRCEYARVAIYYGRVPAGAPEPNYILIKGKTVHMILRHFKTRKHHEAYEIELPPPLVDDLVVSLEKEPRAWLFANAKGSYYSTSAYTHWTTRVFQKLFNKPLTVALIRHSFINTLDFNTISIQEKKIIARSMGHTSETQDRYRLLFKDKNGTCSCVCETI
jgi:hypothetical protein